MGIGNAEGRRDLKGETKCFIKDSSRRQKLHTAKTNTVRDPYRYSLQMESVQSYGDAKNGQTNKIYTSSRHSLCKQPVKKAIYRQGTKHKLLN